MTEERKGLTLSSNQWQILAVGNTGAALSLLNELFKFMQQIRYPTPEDAKGIDEQWIAINKHWDFVKTTLQGWRIAAKNEGLVQPPVPVPQANANALEAAHQPREPVALESSYEVAPKTKGWPKGKPRGPRKPKAIQSSAAVLPPVTQ